MLEHLLLIMEALGDGWKVFFLSMIPISELRVTIPLGILWGMEPIECFLWAISGNLIPLIPLLIGLPLLYECLLKLGVGRKSLARILESFRRKGNKVERYGLLGLIFLVAIPLPGTGVWTGSMVAFLFGLPFAKAAGAIALGAVIAGILVTLASAGVLALSQVIYGMEYIAVLALVVLLIYIWRKKRKNK